GGRGQAVLSGLGVRLGQQRLPPRDVGPLGASGGPWASALLSRPRQGAVGIRRQRTGVAVGHALRLSSKPIQLSTAHLVRVDPLHRPLLRSSFFSASVKGRAWMTNTSSSCVSTKTTCNHRPPFPRPTALNLPPPAWRYRPRRTTCSHSATL